MKKLFCMLLALSLLLSLAPAMGEGLVKGPPTPPPFSRDENGSVVVNTGRQPVIMPTLAPIATPKPTVKPVEYDTPVLSGDAFVSATGELYMSVTSDVTYAVVKQNPITVTASISGGVLPYTVDFTVDKNGETVKETTSTLNAVGGWTFIHQPHAGGKYELEVKVTDAAGSTETGAVTVQVSEPSTEGPALWKKSVAGVKLTGDWRADLVAVAQTQIGYQESTTDFIFDEEDQKRGYTRYGAWYGSTYGEWCAAFIAFCCEYADIPAADFPRDASVPALMDKLDNAGAGHDYRYLPEAGDIVFFSFEGDVAPEHAGIVENVTAGSIYTIEGNSGNMVRRREYALDADEIVGYASVADLMRAAGKLVEDAVLAIELPDEAIGLGYTNVPEVNMRAEPDQQSRRVKKIDEKNSEVAVLLADDATGEMWYFVQYNSHLGYVRGDLLDVVSADAQAMGITDAELDAWMAEVNPTEEMIARAKAAGGLDVLVLEGDAFIYVRTGEAMASYDRRTGLITDIATGLTVGVLDEQTGAITSAAQ